MRNKNVLSLFCIVMFFFSQLSWACERNFFGSLDWESPTDVYYGQGLDYNAPELSQEEIIKREHQQKIFWRRCKNILWSGGQASVAGGVSYLLMGNQNFLMFAGLVGLGFRDKIEQYIQKFNNSIFLPKEVKDLENLELEFALCRNISPKNKEIIKKSIESIRGELAFVRGRSAQEGSTNIKRLKKILALPYDIKKIDLKYDDLCCSITSAMGDTYNKDLVDDIKNMVFDICINAKHEKDQKITKKMYFFLGRPGTGKTTTAKFLAKLLKLPFCQINLSKLENPGELEGTARPDGRGNDNGVVRCGKIASALLDLDNAALNCVCFLDEVHDVVNPKNSNSAGFQSMLKRLLDPEVEAIFDEGLRAYIDISHVIFILAGNEPVDDTCGALRDRMTTYVFPPATMQARIKIAQDCFKKSCEHYGISSADSSFENNKNMINKILRQDSYKQGVRALQKVIKNYARYLAKNKNNLDKIEFDIDRAYKQARGISREDYNKLEK